MIKSIQNNFNTPSFKAHLVNEEQIMQSMAILKKEAISPSVFFPDYLNKLKQLRGNEVFKFYEKMTDKKAKLCTKIEKELTAKLEEIKNFADDTFSVRIGRLVEDKNTTVLTLIDNKQPDYKNTARMFYGTPKNPVKDNSEFELINCVLDIDIKKLEIAKNNIFRF